MYVEEGESRNESIIATFCNAFLSIIGPVLFASPAAQYSPTLGDVLNKTSNGILHSRLLNMTYNCVSKKLSIHMNVSTQIQIVTGMLTFNSFTFSISMFVDSNDAFETVVFSGMSTFFGIPAFVAVRYKYIMKAIDIRGTPTAKNISINSTIESVSMDKLKVPSVLDVLSNLALFGTIEKGITSIAIKGMSNGQIVVLLSQLSKHRTTSAVVANINTASLKGFVKEISDVDISGKPIFTDLRVSNVCFSSATGDITTLLLSQIFPSNSPLAMFGKKLYGGFRAYFTASIVEVSITGILSHHKLKLEIPSNAQLLLSRLLSQYPSLRDLGSFSLVEKGIMSSTVSRFSYDLESKTFMLSSHLHQLLIIPKVMILSEVALEISVAYQQQLSVTQLELTGNWLFASVNVTTHIAYNSTKGIYQVRGINHDKSKTLKINTLFKNILGSNLPEALQLVTLTSVMGKMYHNGKYLIVINGSLNKGSICLVFLKDIAGTKVGLLANVEGIRLSDVVEVSNGIDISGTQYFGGINVSMEISIASSLIEKKGVALPNIFHKRFFTDGSRFLAGVNSHFKMNVLGASDTECSFLNGIVTCTLSKSDDFTFKDLARELHGLSVQDVPSQLSDIFSFKVYSFSYNTTNNEVTITMEINRMTIVKEFLSLSNVSMSFRGRFGSAAVRTTSIDIEGTWHLLEYSVETNVVYNALEKDFSITGSSNFNVTIDDLMLRFTGKSLTLPSSISSISLTGISGKVVSDRIVVALNGAIKGGKIACIFQTSTNESGGAVVVEIAEFKLADLVELASGTDISDIQYFGALQIPRLSFAVATSDISSNILQSVSGSDSPLKMFRNGISKGVLGRALVKVGEAGLVALNYVNKLLTFRATNGSSLSLGALLSAMPGTEDMFSNLPSRLLSLLQTEVESFSFQPDSNELILIGSMKGPLDVVTNLISLTEVKVSVTAILGEKRTLNKVVLSGHANFGKIPIYASVSYDGNNNISLKLFGELKEQVELNELISSLSDNNLRIPSVLSFVRLSKLIGSIGYHGTFLAFSGSINEGQIYFVYQKSSTESEAAVGIAAVKESFRFSSLVSSAVGVDISNIPYFGTLVIPDVGLTISSHYITSPLLSSLYPSSSVLTNFGDSLGKGLRAAFQLTLGEVKGIVANFAEGKLELQAPNSDQLSLGKILQLLPNFKQAIETLPQVLQDIATTTVDILEYRPRTDEIELEGNIKSIVIISNVLVVKDCKYSLLATIGKNLSLKFASFKGLWNFDKLSLKVEVIYDNGIFLIDAFPEAKKGMNLQSLFKKFKKKSLNTPPALNVLEINHVLGKIEKGVHSLVFTGKVGRLANISVVFETSKKSNVVVFAADVKQFKLSDLIHAGTGLDISKVPFFGSLIIPTTSFVISPESFSTLNLPDLDIPGIATELFLETVPKGVKGQFKINIGRAVGLIGEFSGNMLTIKPPTSVSVTLSLLDLMSVIPQMRVMIESLPPILHVLKNSIITSVLYKPNSGKVLITLNVNSLTVVPNLLSLEEVKVLLDMKITGSNIAALQSFEQIEHESKSDFNLQENAKVQVLKVNKLMIEGKWKLLDMNITTFVKYNGNTRQFDIKGTPPLTSKSLSIGNLISKFSSVKLKLPQILSLKIDSIKALSSSLDATTTIIISAEAGVSNKIHFIYQMTGKGPGIAVAADLQFSIVQLIKTVVNIDLSSVPFINSFEEVSMAFTSSNTAIQTPLLQGMFELDSPLQAYIKGIPNGVTAHMNVLIGGCLEVEVTYVKSVINFSVPQKCKVTLRDLLTEIPVVKSGLKALPPPISDLLASNIESIHFDPPTKALSLKAEFPELNFFNVVVLRNLKLALTATLGKNGQVNSVSFSGALILCDLTVSTSVSYNQETQQLFFEASSELDLSIRSIVACLFKANFNVPSFISGAKISNIIGQKIEDTFSFVMSGKIGSKFHVFLVYKRSVGESPEFAIAASVQSFKLADLLNEVVNIDISSIPFLGSLRVPRLGFSNAPSGDIETPLLNRLVPASSPLKKYANHLPSGFSATIDLNIGGSKLTGIYVNKVLSFVPFAGGISLEALLKEIPGIDIISTGITAVFKDIMSLKLKNFVFDIQQKKYSITVYLNRLSVFGKGLLLRDINIMINVAFSEPRTLSVSASGVLSLGKKDYAISIHRSQSTENYVLTIHTEEFPLISLLSAVGGSFLPEDLQILLGKIFDISVLNATLKYPFGAVPKHMLISGMPQLFGLKTVHVTALLIEQGEKTKFIQKYTFPGFSITDLLNKLFGKSIPSKLLQTKSDTSLIVSPLTLKDIRLSVPEFRDIAINEGISVSTIFTWPPSCGGDMFCRVMKSILGEKSKLILQGTFKNARYFSVTVAVGDVKLGAGVVLKRAGLEFVGGVETSIGLVGSIELKSPPVTLNAAMRLKVGGVMLEGSMTGCWERAFGIPVLILCNLFMSISITPVAPHISGLEFGGRIEIGNLRCGRNKLLTAEAYVGINSLDNNQNYFYADRGKLTFQRFFDAFCISVTLPKPLGESGFPKGVKISFSLLGKQLPHAGITIPVGFRFKGTLNILGVSASADINIQPTRLKVTVQLPRLNLLGVLKMYKSRKEKSRGPFFHVDIGATKIPEIDISGFVEVLGISVEGRLLISSTKFEVFVEGRIFGLFIASLRISSGYSKDINSAPFEVEGRFKNDLFDKIAKGVRDGLKKSAEEADKHISAAQNKIRQAKGKFDSGINALERAKRKIYNAKRSFDVAIGKMQGARRKLERICRIKSCGSGKIYTMHPFITY